MSIKRSVIHCDSIPHLNSVAPVATEVALAMDSRIRGVNFEGQTISERRVLSRIPEDAAHKHVEGLKKERKAIKDRFNTLFEDPRLETDWIERRGDADTRLAEEMLYHDLLLMSQHHPEDSEFYRSKVHRSVIHTSTPVVLCPVKPQSSPLSRNICIAWNDSGQSARAVRSALPMLLVADSITVLSLHSRKDAEETSQNLDRLMSYLSSHRVRANVERKLVRGEPKPVHLLDEIGTRNASMGVMGAWGHSRLHEMVLGGFTRDVVKTSRIPVWMNH